MDLHLDPKGEREGLIQGTEWPPSPLSITARNQQDYPSLIIKTEEHKLLLCLLVVPKTKTGQEGCKGHSFPCANLSQNLCQLALCDGPHRRLTAQDASAVEEEPLQASTGGREQPGAWDEKVRPPQKTLPMALS